MADSCGYENRCLNNNKCYRCFNESLLKLPEDKQKSKNNKFTKVRTEQQKQSDDSWKLLEQDTADLLNKVPTMKEARRSIASGALWFEKGDVVDEILMPECKERKGRTLLGGEKSISIQRGWLEKADAEAQSKGRIMVNPFRFKEDDNIYANIKMTDLAELVTMMKAVQLDNNTKDKEIELLKKEIRKLKEK